MQNAKDSFYVALRNRLSTLNPARTLMIRAVQRPGVLVEEAESPMPEAQNDVFTLRWEGFSTDSRLPNRLSSAICEIQYSTSGTQGNAGLDRGRALSEMDRELLAILQPLWTPKMSYTVTPAILLETNVFWSEPTFGDAARQRGQLTRAATVTVYAFEEPGEL